MQGDFVALNDPERGPLLHMESQLCVLPVGPDDQQQIDRMLELLRKHEEDALAIAAVQVGYPKRFFVMREEDGNLLVCINPRILSKSSEFARKPEGCLSIPGFTAKPTRPRAVQLEYYSPDGGRHERIFRGLRARCVCHEMDHLDGKLLTHHFELQMAHHAQKTETKQRVKAKAVRKNRQREKLRRKQNRRNRR